MRTTLLTALVAGMLFSAPAFSQQSRLAEPSGTNAKSPPSKSKTPPKAAAVTTSKAVPLATASGKSVGTTTLPTSAPNTPVVAPKTPVVAPKTPVVAPKTPVVAPKTPAQVVPTTPAATKTVAGKTTGEKVAVAKVATIARPATTVETAVNTASPVVLPTGTKADIGKAVEGLATGALSRQDFTALLAGGALTPQQFGALLAGGALPPGAALKPVEVAKTPAKVEPTAPDFSLALKALPAVTETAKFKAWTWAPVDRAATDFQVATIWVAMAGGWCQSDPRDVARQLNEQPVGQRVLFLWDMTSDIASNPGDNINVMQGGTIKSMPSPWMDVGTDMVRQRISSFITAFVNAGGKLDAVLVDNEPSLRWSSGRFNAPEQIVAIEADARFPQLAAELGFNHLEQLNVAPAFDAALQSLEVRWDEVMGGRFDAALQSAVFEPIRAAFPNAVVSNYESFSVNGSNPTPWCTGAPDLRQSAGFGTHDTHSYYGLISNFLAVNTKYGGAIGGDAYSGFRLQVNRWRACDLATTRPMQAWIAPANNPSAYTTETGIKQQYDPNVALTLTNNSYYDEMLLQLGVSGCDTYLFWNPIAYCCGMDPAVWNKLDDQRRVDSCLRELNQMLGQTLGAVVLMRGPTFNDLVVASGRQVGDRMVWRFTFSPGINSVIVKFTDGSTATVTKDANRPGAWFSYPANMTIRMNAANSAPEMVVGPSP